MKTPSKVSKSPSSSKSPKNSGLTGAQYVSVVNSATQLGSSFADYAAEAERTEQVKAQSLRDMHVSNNEVQIAHYKLTERTDELSVERMKLENARKAADDSHERWMMDHESREELAKILREKLNQSTITEQELLILQNLYVPASDK
ncbi:hypothetical protein TUM17576_22800 [Enterobacter hormaechei]|uniref:Uncharacterized protein n=1 Tax=Phytobacter ursingii TaxID=1972431 RepID=A0AB35RMY5_9ENTR|nr:MULTISPECIES: hypothetical protein [Enterobacteriaceae]MDV2863509.1 hypothetical protein [Phytobacter ursingii]GJL35460.1 hypothetical protein TUM17576_22800 [Enterobacter hormaechei]